MDNIDDNLIGDEGGIPIGQALQENPTIIKFTICI